MSLSTDLISQFVKTTNDRSTKSKESTLYGEVVLNGGRTYVKLDGSDQLTPVSTTTDMKNGERVTVRIKDHTAVATGNVSSPAARVADMEAMFHDISEDEVSAIKGIFEELYVHVGTFESLTAEEAAILRASIEELEAKYATITEADVKKLSAEDANILNADIENLVAKIGTFDSISAEEADIVRADIEQLTARNAAFGYVSADRFSAALAEIQVLDVEKLTADQADFRYANIDFANIGEAAMEFFYSKSGLIENVKVGDQTIAGELVGVTIRGDRLIGNTIVADKLVIRGDDGLYYKLNTQGVSPEGKTEEQIEYAETGVIETPPPDGTLIGGVATNEGREVYSYVDDEGITKYYSKSENEEYYDVTAETKTVHLEQTVDNSLDGSNITAHTITATHITVNDLVAFDATIGRFVIDGDADDETAPGSIHTVGKNYVDSSTEGIFMDSSGQVNIGDKENFIKYVQNGDGSYSLAISAKSIEFALTDPDGNPTGETRSLSSLGNIGEYVRITTLDGEPCIELGESDSDFKLYITNTRILFAQGSVHPAWITNQALHIDKAVVENELRFGQFVWQKHDEEGNMGIVWLDEEVAE